ncbi:MAG: hypothetical protein ACF8MJ_07210 [Phycisphaerales bacterium JB050]
MPKIVIDPTITRQEAEGFAYPLGVYPVESLKPAPGFTVEFESADGDNESDWEEWPDRFMFDVVVTSQRLRSLCKLLFSFLPGRVYPILDVLGNDAYREIDPYISYELVSIERFLDGVIQFEDWLFEDGLVGFGAMSMNPFLYVFVDEHKAVTIRVGLDLKDRVERSLAAFDLTQVQELVSVDSVAHEHRTVLLPPTETEAVDSLAPEDIIERLVESWLLQLNVDPRTNVDDSGRDLGFTAWRMVARCLPEENSDPVYAEVIAVADCLENAEAVAVRAVAEAPDAPGRPGNGWLEVHLPVCDRVTPEGAAKALDRHGEVALTGEEILRVRWFKPQRQPE